MCLFVDDTDASIGIEVDTYAYAITVLHLISGTPPFAKFQDRIRMDEQLFFYTRISREQKRCEISKNVPSNVRELIENCWKQKPEDRWKMSVVKEKLKAMLENCNDK